jgi:LysM repeat protein
MKAMTTLRFALLPAFDLSLVSCFNKGSADTAYDTSNPYGVPEYGGSSATTQAAPPAAQAPAAAAPASNPVYDTPAAYEENTSRPTAPPPVDSAIVDPGIAPGAPKPAPREPAAAPGAPAATPSAPAHVELSGTIHTVGKGDSLWAIGKKYGVSVESLKKANGLTKDTVVIGQKLQIPVR